MLQVLGRARGFLWPPIKLVRPSRPVLSWLCIPQGFTHNGGPVGVGSVLSLDGHPGLLARALGITPKEYYWVDRVLGEQELSLKRISWIRAVLAGSQMPLIQYVYGTCRAMYRRYS